MQDIIVHDLVIGLSPGVNFIDILRAVFACAYPKCTKKTDNLTVIFALPGSVHAKTARRTLMKLTLELNSINVL